MKRAGLAVLLFFASFTFGADSISARDAKNHIGERVTVCGLVVGTHYAASSRGRPTFINLDQAYPNQIFTIVIWGSDRPKFGRPETSYASKHVCVNGPVTLYRGVPETIAKEPAQITVR